MGFDFQTVNKKRDHSAVEPDEVCQSRKRSRTEYDIPS